MYPKIKRFLFISILFCVIIVSPSILRAQEKIVQNFDDGWREFDSVSGNPRLEKFVKDGWFGDMPPYIIPQVDFQMGPARIYRREGDVISGKYALGVETGTAPLNILSSCRLYNSPRRAMSQVSAWLRGKGQVRLRIYAYNEENRAISTPFIGTFEVTPEWKLYKALYEAEPDVKVFSAVLEVAPNSAVDVDDIAIGYPFSRELVMPAGVPEVSSDFEKVAVAFSTDSPILIDGRLDDPAWLTAEWNSGFLRHKDQSTLTPVQAQFAFLFDESYLYFCLVSAEEGIDVDRLKPTPPGKWPDGQPVEIFLDPGATRDIYYQFAANILGGTYESRRTDATWDCNWKAEGSAGGNRFIIEAAIPFSAFDRSKPQLGEIWALNICRNGPYMGPWAPVGPAYHNPAGFGLLVFGTYEEWWNQGFLLQSKKELKELDGIAEIKEDVAISRQLEITAELLKELHSKRENGSTELNRKGFLDLFRRAEQIRIMLKNIAMEWQWVQAVNLYKE